MKSSLPLFHDDHVHYGLYVVQCHQIQSSSCIISFSKFPQYDGNASFTILFRDDFSACMICKKFEEDTKSLQLPHASFEGLSIASS
mmetsp:Transcript_10421/g.12094  ORF Transcript_10421/g.12094 Transcript_10421/m.12094 type:complete len:86 (+) Transcript_10421:207-464(+)